MLEPFCIKAEMSSSSFARFVAAWSTSSTRAFSGARASSGSSTSCRFSRVVIRWRPSRSRSAARSVWKRWPSWSTAVSSVALLASFPNTYRRRSNWSELFPYLIVLFTFKSHCKVFQVLWTALQKVEPDPVLFSLRLDPNFFVMAAFMIQTRIFTDFHVLVTGCRHFGRIEYKLSVETGNYKKCL